MQTRDKWGFFLWTGSSAQSRSFRAGSSELSIHLRKELSPLTGAENLLPSGRSSSMTGLDFSMICSSGRVKFLHLHDRFSTFALSRSLKSPPNVKTISAREQKNANIHFFFIDPFPSRIPYRTRTQFGSSSTFLATSSALKFWHFAYSWRRYNQ